MDKISQEQEVLLALADIAIQVQHKKTGVAEAAVKVFAFSASESAGSAARKAAFYIEESDTLNMLLSGVRRFSKFDTSGLLAAKRLLADASCEEGKYMFC